MMRLSTRNPGLLVILVGSLACTRSTAPVAPGSASIQAAAIAFLARANGDRAACILVARGPSELTEGRVTGQLHDPAADLEIDLATQGMKGVTVRAFSTCSAADRDKVTYAIGWPRSTARGFEVNADRLCGARCGEGNLVLVKRVGSVWRAVEAETTWRS